jgi:hypothetical protein
VVTIIERLPALVIMLAGMVTSMVVALSTVVVRRGAAGGATEFWKKLVPVRVTMAAGGLTCAPLGQTPLTALVRHARSDVEGDADGAAFC